MRDLHACPQSLGYSASYLEVGYEGNLERAQRFRPVPHMLQLAVAGTTTPLIPMPYFVAARRYRTISFKTEGASKMTPVVAATALSV